MDAANGDQYFANDTRAGHPSVIFDTNGLNGNGVLDWEDTDNDGTLDKPNVYRRALRMCAKTCCPGTSARPTRLSSGRCARAEDHLRCGGPSVSWAKMASLCAPRGNMCITFGRPKPLLRCPMRSRGESRPRGRLLRLDLYDRQHHRRSGQRGLRLRNARVDAFPEGIQEALETNELEGGTPSTSRGALIGTLADLGLFSGDSADALVDNYAFGDRVVGGSFTPFFGDLDHGPAPGASRRPQRLLAGRHWNNYQSAAS